MTENIIQQIDVLLKKVNYETLVFETKAKFCFDLLVKKDNSILLIKVFPNIDNLNETVINGIKTLSVLLQSKPILIGIKNRYQTLEDNTIYMREDLPFITLATFENIIEQDAFPYILAKRGGGIIFLDGGLMKTLREDKNITRKEISEDLGVTKRTICAYENESMRPSQQMAQKILKLLDDSSLFKKINIFEWNIKFTIDQKEISNEDELNPLETHIKNVIDDIGIASQWYKKGQVPFELSIYSKGANLEEGRSFYPVFSGVPESSKINERNLKALMTFSHLFDKQAVFIVDNDFKVPESIEKNIPVIKIKLLDKIDTETEFIELIKEKEI